MTQLTAKILIKEGETHCSGGGASITTIGSAHMIVHSIHLGVRLSSHKCGESQLINREYEHVQYVKIGNKEYVVGPVGTHFQGDIAASEAGCEYEITIDRKDGIMFESDPPIAIVQLIDDYREN